MQSKDDGKYLRFQRDHKSNLYYMDISKENVEEHCYFNTAKKGKSLFSILDRKRAEVVKALQANCAFPSNEDFINALECNSIEGVDFGRRDVNIANEIYGFSKGEAMC